MQHIYFFSLYLLLSVCGYCSLSSSIPAALSEAFDRRDQIPREGTCPHRWACARAGTPNDILGDTSALFISLQGIIYILDNEGHYSSPFIISVHDY